MVTFFLCRSISSFDMVTFFLSSASPASFRTEMRTQLDGETRERPHLATRFRRTVYLSQGAVAFVFFANPTVPAAHWA
jgi:hypothetical protein